VTHYALIALAPSAVSLLLLSASIGSATSQPYPSRDFDAVPSASERAADAQATSAKAWYDRDFDFSVESAVDARESSATEGFDEAETGSDRIRRQTVQHAR
jgi:hypothetical protein